MVADVKRLLLADGLVGVPVLPVSAREGLGIDALKAEIARRVRAKEATRTRITADVGSAAQRMRAVSGDAAPVGLPPERVAALEQALADSAGVPTVVRAVEDSTRMRANRATGWPVTAWFSRLKPDPLKRLHLDLGMAGRELTGVSRTSMPAPTRVQQARVDAEVRQLADEMGAGLTRPWQAAIRRASLANLPDLSDRLDKTLAGTDLGVAKMPVWAGAVRVLQWLLILTALAGGLWLAALAVMGYLQLPAPETPRWQGIPVPTLMLLGGVILGLLLAGCCRVLVNGTARSRAKTADRRLRKGIHQVTQELVVAPIETELAAYQQVRTGLATALK